MGRVAGGDRAVAADFGRRVRAERKRIGLSQEGLAARAGIHRTFVGRVERGEANVTLTTIVRLADVFGVDPGALVAGFRGTK
ncbi:helix-turn-helix domain-containing protein [Actinomarinicola tropica]|uniref:Helix-turn-helix domain-containing protein n=1 Tax=Actinomarinicola tropica TaxID=2789776 RepID=A0A5Q2RP15_9ACTN|nr:helix-turn-helix transcriptional regulator [Actinomarinicola tropica]QGG94945.1 helix-turn-helix domain-containing protein [Actinomarinicola tropica]